MRREAQITAQVTEMYLRSNGSPVYSGSAVEFFTSIYKNQDLPLNIRMAAAAQAKEYEEPKMTESREAFLAARAKEVSEAERQRRLDAECKTIDELIAIAEQTMEENALLAAAALDELQGLVDAGERTANAAAKIRSWWAKPMPLLPAPSETPIVEPDDVPYSPPGGGYFYDGKNPPAAPTAREAPAPLYDTPEPVHRARAASPSPASAPSPAPRLGGGLDNADLRDVSQHCTKPMPPGAAVVLFTEPHKNFWVDGVGTVSADEDGEIVASDAATASALPGCRTAR
jgi:hypothetical protein